VKPHEESDRELVDKILSGDREAAKRMYQLYAPKLIKRLYRLTGSYEQAEDCLQQVFADALQKLDTYRGDGVLLAWLHRIGTNVVFQGFRKQQSFKNFLGEMWPRASEKTIQEPLPEKLFMEEERKQLLHEILDSLGGRKRIVILLCDLEGMKVEDAAEHLDIPTGTVASRLYHARRDLKKKLEAELKKRGSSVEEWLHV